MHKAIRTLIGGPEATAEFLAVQENWLNEAVLVSFEAMSRTNLAALDRVIKIVREFDLHHGLPGKDGTERRRKPLECLDPRAEMAPLPSPRGQGRERGADGAGHGTDLHRKPLKTFDSGAQMAQRASAGGWRDHDRVAPGLGARRDRRRAVVDAPLCSRAR